MSLADVTACVRGVALAWLGLERPRQEEAELAERRVSCGSWLSEHDGSFVGCFHWRTSLPVIKARWDSVPPVIAEPWHFQWKF